MRVCQIIHRIVKCMWTAENLISNHDYYYYVSALLGKLSTTFWDMAAGIYTHLATRTFVRSAADVEQQVLDLSQRYNV